MVNKEFSKVGKFNCVVVSFKKEFVKVADIQCEPTIESFSGDKLTNRLFKIGARALGFVEDKRCYNGWRKKAH